MWRRSKLIGLMVVTLMALMMFAGVVQAQEPEGSSSQEPPLAVREVIVEEVPLSEVGVQTAGSDGLFNSAAGPSSGDRCKRHTVIEPHHYLGGLVVKYQSSTLFCYDGLRISLRQPEITDSVVFRTVAMVEKGSSVRRVGGGLEYGYHSDQARGSFALCVTDAACAYSFTITIDKKQDGDGRVHPPPT